MRDGDLFEAGKLEKEYIDIPYTTKNVFMEDSYKKIKEIEKNREKMNFNTRKMKEDVIEFFSGVCYLLIAFSFIGWGISGFGIGFIADASPENRGYVAIFVLSVNISLFSLWFIDRYKVKK